MTGISGRWERCTDILEVVFQEIDAANNTISQLGEPMYCNRTSCNRNDIRGVVFIPGVARARKRIGALVIRYNSGFDPLQSVVQEVRVSLEEGVMIPLVGFDHQLQKGSVLGLPNSPMPPYPRGYTGKTTPHPAGFRTQTISDALREITGR